MRKAALLACLALPPLWSGAALAHHPGSHASRLPDGRVRVEVAAVATDGCTRIDRVRAAAPSSVSAVPGAAAVTAELVRAGAGPCTMAVVAVTSETVLDVAPGLRQIMLYILAPDGTLASTERVPIRQDSCDGARRTWLVGEEFDMVGDRVVQAASTVPPVAELLENFRTRRARIGVVGLGYVGIPLALTAAKAGFKVLGFDINEPRVGQINRGENVIKHVNAADLADAVSGRAFEATADFTRLDEPDAILICVPTPLTRHREPDLSYVENTVRTAASRLRRGQLIVLESTTYPGTTDEVVRPILEATGLKSGEDFFLAYSPEREDPGNPDFGTSTIPKVIGGDGPDALLLADALYSQLVVRTVPVSSTATAEAVKLTENIFRAVNIALANELKVVYAAMGIDVWEVIDAAKTKPFGFMPFYPGPGLGGHCVPIDPFYLTWKAREHDIATHFIELAGQINTRMPYYVVDRLVEAVDRNGTPFAGSRVLVLGIAYKKNVDDTRESPSLKLIRLIEQRGADVDYHDPHVPVIPVTREHASLAGRKSIDLSAEAIASYDAVLIATDHDDIDYRLVVAHAKVTVDTRNACARSGVSGGRIVKA